MAPSKDVASSSGTWSVTRSSALSAPVPMSAPATVPHSDLETDWSRCRVLGVMPSKYISAATRPPLTAMKPSVDVELRKSPRDRHPPPCVRKPTSSMATGSGGSSSTGPSPRSTRADGTSCATCRNAQRLKGARCQFDSVTAPSPRRAPPSAGPAPPMAEDGTWAVTGS